MSQALVAKRRQQLQPTEGSTMQTLTFVKGEEMGGRGPKNLIKTEALLLLNLIMKIEQEVSLSWEESECHGHVQGKTCVGSS